MADTVQAKRTRLRFIRWVWAHSPRPLPVLMAWARRRNRVLRFTSLAQWARQRQESARTPRARAKFKALYEKYTAKADYWKAQQSRPTYRMGGWGGTGAARLQRVDQGQDFEIPRGHWITSPGYGEIIAHSADRPFPNGFGNPYAIVKITSGRFAIGNGEWYVGHCNQDVRPVGTKLKPGDPIARANNSLNTGWGWCELGKWDGGPHGMGYGANYSRLFTDVKL